MRRPTTLAVLLLLAAASAIERARHIACRGPVWRSALGGLGDLVREGDELHRQLALGIV